MQIIAKRTALIGVTMSAFSAVTGLVVQQVLAAGVPGSEALIYSGELALADGSPVEGTRNIGIALHDAITDSKRLCDVLSSPVIVTRGRFQVSLGDACVAAVKTSPDVWVDVQVDGASIGRTKLGTVPYAIEAAEASSAVGLLAQQVVPSGSVMAFDLPKCPAGWTEFELARGRVVVGLNTGLTRGTPVGANSLTLSVSQLPAHSHTGTTGPGTAMVYRVVGTPGLSYYANHAAGWTGGDNYVHRNDAEWPMAAHTHAFTTDAAGAGASIDNRQDSVPLLYCRKN